MRPRFVYALALVALTSCAGTRRTPATAASAPASAPRGAREGGAPVTRISRVVDTLHGVAVEDRYRWLESQTSPEVLAWIEAQNRYAEQVLGPPNADRSAITSRLRSLLDLPAVGAPRRGGDWEYFTLRRTGEEVAAIYRRRWMPGAPLVVPDSS